MMGIMKQVEIEIKNSQALSYLLHEINQIKTQQMGNGIMIKDLLTAVDLKHLD